MGAIHAQEEQDAPIRFSLVPRPHRHDAVYKGFEMGTARIGVKGGRDHASRRHYHAVVEERNHQDIFVFISPLLVVTWVVSCLEHPRIPHRKLIYEFTSLATASGGAPRSPKPDLCRFIELEC